MDPEQPTGRVTRSKKKPANREPPRVRDWLDGNWLGGCGGSGIFIQRKPHANVQNQWENEASLLLASNREKPYTVTIEDGESIELRLRVNSDFWVSPPADGSSRAGLRVDEDGIPTNRVEFRYYDLFYLTANHGALGMLTGPGEWTFAASVDEETDILCVTATCQHKGWTVRKETVLVPLSIEVGKYLFLNVDLDKLEAMAPGARAEQSDHIRGGADRRRAELLREERKAQSRAGSEGPDRAPGTPARTSRELSRDQAGKQASKSQGQIRRGGLESSIHCRVVWGAEKGEIQAVDSGDDKWHVSVLTKSLEKSGNARQK